MAEQDILFCVGPCEFHCPRALCRKVCSFACTKHHISRKVCRDRYSSSTLLFVRIPDLPASRDKCYSGANDGLGYPFLFLALLLMRLPTHEALTTWFLDIILYDIVYAAALGFVAGYVARVLLRYAQET